MKSENIRLLNRIIRRKSTEFGWHQGGKISSGCSVVCSTGAISPVYRAGQSRGSFFAAPVVHPGRGKRCPGPSVPQSASFGRADSRALSANIYAHATREAKRTSARLLDKVVCGE